MNPTKNSVLPAYLGDCGPSYASNDNIPNPWVMIPSPYYLGNPPLTFSNTISPTTYPFPNMVFIGIVATRGSQGVQTFVMIPSIIAPTGGFSIRNLVPYFQPLAQNPPSRFGNFGGGIPIRGGGSLPHGNEGPL
jgi:hypothetical protein